MLGVRRSVTFRSLVHGYESEPDWPESVAEGKSLSMKNRHRRD